MVICLEQGADLHMVQLMPLPLIVSCFSKIQIGFTFLVPAHLGSPGKGPLNGCVCVIKLCLQHDFLAGSIRDSCNLHQTWLVDGQLVATATNVLHDQMVPDQ